MKLSISILFLLIFSSAFAQNINNFDSCMVIQPDGENGIDAEIFSCSSYGYDTTNFGNIQDICATDWTRFGQESIIRSLIFFDLSVVPTNKTIKSAKLSLYYNPSSTEGQHSSLTGANTSEIQRITTPWSEYGVTWTNQPQTTSLHKVTLSASTSPTQNFINVDITQLVIDSRNNPSSSYGFLFKQITEQYYRKLVFASSDHPTDSLHPKLVICFNSATNGLENNKTKFNFSCFPNPATDILNLRSQTITGLVDIKIIDLYGRTIRKINIYFSEDYTVDISRISAGIYFIIISNREGLIERKRIIIE